MGGRSSRGPAMWTRRGRCMRSISGIESVRGGRVQCVEKESEQRRERTATMPEVLLTADQARIVAEAWGPVCVRDPAGKIVGHIEPVLSPELIAELKRRARSPGPWFTGKQVQARLQALQAEWDRTGGFDQAYMERFLEQLNQKD